MRRKSHPLFLILFLLSRGPSPLVIKKKERKKEKKYDYYRRDGRNEIVLARHSVLAARLNIKQNP